MTDAAMTNEEVRALIERLRDDDYCDAEPEEAADALTALLDENARLQAEMDHVKQVEFPAKIDKVCAAWMKRAEAAESALATVRRDTLEQAAKACDGMVDWPLEKHPAATASGPLYVLGIHRGLVNATNAIRALAEQPKE